ncbi:hypothetical protein EKK58_08280 [Candidatus Dependentiae bacterium]|nr:MAG: hypothetical protein EKK58_08280 [Candidatus Dependentiae bacterium]
MDSKNISTLVDDIRDVITKKGGWDSTVSEFFRGAVGDAMDRRFTKEEEERKPTLRMSNIGTPCKRKLWYYLNTELRTTDLPAGTLLKFAYGDLIEGLLLSLAKAAGHTVEGEQDEIVVDGIVGHRDAVIDGVTIDVKSASTPSFKKFEKNELRVDDPFGYIQQLTGYVYGGKDDPLVTDKKGGAFLVMDKTLGHIHLDYYDLTPELSLLPSRLVATKMMSTMKTEPYREWEPVPDGKSGNMKLPSACSYCDYKWNCWPGLRGFAYSNGPTYLTRVAKLPAVPEFKER